MSVHLNDVPHYVYRCYSADGALLYVGFTHNLVQREASHRTQSLLWYRHLASVRLVGPFTGRNARRRARNVERNIIETERPLHNVTYTDAGRKAQASVRRLKDAQHQLHGKCAYRCRECRCEVPA